MLLVECTSVFSVVFTALLYRSKSTSWQWRGLKSVPRSDLLKVIQRSYFSTYAGSGTIVALVDFVLNILYFINM